MITAAYMQWAKHRPRALNDLAASGMRAVTTEELLGDELRASEAFLLSGPNDNGFAPLVEAIATFEGVTSSRVACAAGASGANALVVLALISAGDEVVIESPAYDPLVALLALAGARVRRVARHAAQAWQLSPDDVAAAITDRTRLVVITNPHNPTGAVLAQDALRDIGRAAARVGAHVLVDEVYRAAPLPGRPPVPSAAPFDGPFVVTNSLTKAWGLPGLRAGWVVAGEEVAERIRRTRDLLDVIGAFPAEQLAARAFARLDWLTGRTASLLAAQWPLVEQTLRSCPALEFVPPGAGMIVFPRVRDERLAGEFADRLLAGHQTLVVPGRFFEAPSHFRLSFGGPRDALERGLAAVRAVAGAP